VQNSEKRLGSYDYGGGFLIESEAIDLVSSLAEVTGREGKELVLLVRVARPKAFYQVLGIQTPRLRARLGKYLTNACLARGINDSTSVEGEISIMGYLEESNFADFKTSFRALIGSEGQSNLLFLIEERMPSTALSFSFEFKDGRFTKTSFSARSSTPTLRSGMDLLFSLSPSSWLPK
jgi:hypothetical protein